MAVQKFNEGDRFGVPLPSGGYAAGIVARKGAGGVLVGYFFGPRLGATPSVGQTSWWTPAQATLIAKFGHLGLQRGTWPVYESALEWQRTDWPMPYFERREEITGRVIRTWYLEDDPSRVLREETGSATDEAAEDGLMGAVFVEKRLDRLLPEVNS